MTAHLLEQQCLFSRWLYIPRYTPAVSCPWNSCKQGWDNFQILFCTANVSRSCKANISTMLVSRPTLHTYTMHRTCRSKCPSWQEKQIGLNNVTTWAHCPCHLFVLLSHCRLRRQKCWRVHTLILGRALSTSSSEVASLSPWITKGSRKRCCK